MRQKGFWLAAFALAALGIGWLAWQSARRPAALVQPGTPFPVATPAAAEPATPIALPSPAPVAAKPTPIATPLPFIPQTPVPPRMAARMALTANLPPPPSGPVSRPEIEQVQGQFTHLQTALRDYAQAFDGNPVGTNADITRALLGDNPRHMRMNIPDGMKLNGAGELCDGWGTPLFFHQLSKSKMEIRSAGPDREMWTNDDIQR